MSPFLPHPLLFLISHMFGTNFVLPGDLLTTWKNSWRKSLVSELPNVQEAPTACVKAILTCGKSSALLFSEVCDRLKGWS